MGFTPSNPTRSLDTVYQPHATKAVHVAYTVRITITGGEDGTVRLLSDASDPPTTLICQARNQRSALAAGSVTEEFVLTHIVPPGHHVELETVTGAGAPTFASVRATETVFEPWATGEIANAAVTTQKLSFDPATQAELDAVETALQAADAVIAGDLAAHEAEDKSDAHPGLIEAADVASDIALSPHVHNGFAEPRTSFEDLTNIPEALNPDEDLDLRTLEEIDDPASITSVGLREAAVAERGYGPVASTRASSILADRAPVEEVLEFMAELDTEPRVGDEVFLEDVGLTVIIREIEPLTDTNYRLRCGTTDGRARERVRREIARIGVLERYS